MVWLLYGSAVCTANDTYSADTVKAAYLYRFAGYVEWPEEPASSNHFVIAVVGDPGVARELRRLLPQHRINQQIGEVREIRDLREIGSAQMLFIGAGRTEILAALGPVESKSMLIVTEDEKGLELGSVLNFVTIDNRVRFEVSLTAADRFHLKISADLLSVAVRVHGGRRQTDFSCVSALSVEDPESPCHLRLAFRDPHDALPGVNAEQRWGPGIAAVPKPAPSPAPFAATCRSGSTRSTSPILKPARTFG
jgi:hypothetical protein